MFEITYRRSHTGRWSALRDGVPFRTFFDLAELLAAFPEAEPTKREQAVSSLIKDRDAGRWSGKTVKSKADKLARLFAQSRIGFTRYDSAESTYLSTDWGKVRISGHLPLITPEGRIEGGMDPVRRVYQEAARWNILPGGHDTPRSVFGEIRDMGG